MSRRAFPRGMRVILCSMMVALALASTAVLAQTPPVMARGQGATGCGQWVDAIAREDPNRFTQADANKAWVRETYRAWVLGYLSGAASASNLNFWGRAGVNNLDNESVFLWIGNYCRANPLKLVVDAADALFLERCFARDLPCR